MKAQICSALLLTSVVALLLVASWCEERHTVSPTSKLKEVQTDTTPQRILLFGDSMLEEFVKRFSAWCEAGGHAYYSVIWYGSTTTQWAETDSLKHAIQHFHPSFVIACVGGNELYAPNPTNSAKAVGKISALCDSIPMLWLGTPSWRKGSTLNSAIARQMGEKAFFVTDSLHLSRAADGIHPNAAEAARWADKVVQFIKDKKALKHMSFRVPVEKEGAWRTHIKLITP